MSSASVDALDGSQSQPFRRGSISQQEHGTKVGQELKRILQKLGENVDDEGDEKGGNFDDFLSMTTHQLVQRWRQRDGNSELAFQGLMVILEFCLGSSAAQDEAFAHLLQQLGYNSVAFWRLAVPRIYDSDLAHGTHYRDALLFAIALYDVNTGKNRLRELYAAVPGIRQSMLGSHAKRFSEKYRHLQMQRSRTNSRSGSRRGSLVAADVIHLKRALEQQQQQHGGGTDMAEVVSSLAETMHLKQRVINVSNAPPGSGGLVACVDPVMSADKENVWLANLGFNPKETEVVDPMKPSTNSLGLPLIRQPGAGEIFHVLEPEASRERSPNCERDLSLLNVIHDYNKTNYQLNPVIVSQEDYNAYYGGISNGLLWPALHNLSAFIVKEYESKRVLREHWCAYVRVNYQFALDAVRHSRQQDFIWIHDYHLMLTGQIMRSLDSNLEVGFFLHIPFQPPNDWMTKYQIVSDPLLRALLRFNKVGFQTHRDREKYVQLVKQHIARARISFDSNVDIYSIKSDGWTCSLGVFPVSIKNEDFLRIVRDEKTIVEAKEIRKRLLSTGANDGCLFFSVERFDYTKGIFEKLKAWQRYLEKHPERQGRDLLFQVAVTNRRSVESYRQYQDDCVALADSINEQFRHPDYPNWRPIKFETDGLPRAKLIAHYLAMDVGVVTPSKDGMNLVAKEMVICNPSAALVLSTGAGTEVQLSNAGFYSNDHECYLRVENLQDTEKFADVFYKAAMTPAKVRKENGVELNKFLRDHDIDKWSAAFLDPSWTHEVIRSVEVKQLSEFYILMDKTSQVRRQIVERVLKGIAVRQHFCFSLENARNSLEKSCKSGTHILELITSDEDGHTIQFDISDELDELEKDLAFLSFIASEDINNVENFILSLGSHHPDGVEGFSRELDEAVGLLSDGDHFHYLFTDRDGTLKSYACSYPTSVQPAYSAVIQAQFARRCAQFCAILTTAPLMHIGILNVVTMPEGYYAYGASAGREWYFNPAQQFKDETVNETDMALLNKAFEAVEDLLEQPAYRNFTWIGSGLQKHYGHITIARQDVNHSVPGNRSAQLTEKIHELVSNLDPEAVSLTVWEGEFDLKIFAKTGSGIFDKGDGIRLLVERLGLKMNEGNILVCGDSETDLPMLEACMERCAEADKVYSIWVTVDEQLRERVRKTCAQYDNAHLVFVSCPVVLLGAMAQATVRQIKIRPGDTHDNDDE